jgi:hypothetical protein
VEYPFGLDPKLLRRENRGLGRSRLGVPMALARSNTNPLIDFGKSASASMLLMLSAGRARPKQANTSESCMVNMPAREAGMEDGTIYLETEAAAIVKLRWSSMTGGEWYRGETSEVEVKT